MEKPVCRTDQRDFKKYSLQILIKTFPFIIQKLTIMINKIFTLFIAALFISNVSFAKIWRVNNDPDITADFTTAQAAHDAASAGDTIHLEPSKNTYGALTTSKKLVWISTGEFLTYHPGLQYSSTPARLLTLTVNAGSANSVFSVNIIDGNYVRCNTSNITFLRCYFWVTTLSNASDCVIKECLTKSYVSLNNSKLVMFTNNIIGDYISVPENSSAVIINNVINYSAGGRGTIYNSILQNNIFNKGAAHSFSNCDINNNMANNGLLPEGNDNLNNVDMSTVFVKNTGSTDADFVLKADSPARGTGYGGIDMGAFGGSTPYVFALQPAVPAIYHIYVPGAPTGSTMNVTFSTKSNN